MKRIATSLSLLLAAGLMTAQTAFRHVDVGLTVGSLGYGLEVATPLTDFLDLRTGFTYMPHFEAKMDFGIDIYDADGNIREGRFQKMADLLGQVTGFQVDSKVDMIGQPSYNNFKLLLDFKPFRNKNWSITAGFYLGNRSIARAYNTTEDMPSLFAVSWFNHLREVYNNDQPWFVLNDVEYNIMPELGERIATMGEMGIRVGEYTHDVLYEEDEYYQTFTVDETGVHEAGDLMHAAGEVKYPAGTPYLMKPDEECMAKARIRVNAFRPYLGFGYGGRLHKGDDRYWVHLECGALFWGGTPQIITHDGTDLAKDVKNVTGKVGRYVDFFSAFKVYPQLGVRLVRRF